MTTEQKHEIEIPGLPEGWLAVAYRRLENGDFYLNEQCEIVENYALTIFALIVEKIKTRTSKIEETGEFRTPNKGEFYSYLNGPIEQCDVDDAGDTVRIYRVVEEE